VVGGDREETRLRRGDARELLEGSLGAVVVDHDAVEQRGRCAAGPDRCELVASRFDGLLHAPGGVVDEVLDDPLAHVVTTVPTRSPHTIRSMLSSSSMLNTWIGSELSMQSESAVESMT